MRGSSRASEAARPGARFLSWLPAAAAMALIFWLSSLPGDELPLPEFRFADKLAHFLAYAVLGALIGWRHSLRVRLGGRPEEPRPGAWFPDTAGALAGILFGLSDEVHQLFVPMRLFAWSDFAADGLGVLAGLRLMARLSGDGRGRGSGGPSGG